MRSLILTTSLIISCGLSLIFNAWFFSSMATNLVMQILLVAVAIVFDLAKMLTIPIGTQLWRQSKHLISLLSYAMYLVLSLVSITSGIKTLELNLNSVNNTKALQDYNYQQLLSSNNNLNQLIASMQETARLDTANGYRARANKTQQDILVAQQQLQQLQLELKNYQPTTAINLPSYLLVTLGGLLEVVVAYLLIITSCQVKFTKANKIDLNLIAQNDAVNITAIQQYATATNYNPATKPQGYSSRVIGRVETSVSAKPCGTKGLSGFNPGVIKSNAITLRVEAGLYDEVVKNITSGVWPVNQLEIKKLARIGSNKVMQIFSCLLQDKIICKNGRKYALVT